ncbi:MAG: glycine--tRNA ligase, partial [Oscillospiraceae bacterium]|nr:glycine--tRNA ligase [Oscillospiraceae bacterium]
IEPSLGVERLFLTIVCEAYDEEEIGEGDKSDVRTVMHLHPALAPVKAAILPLTKKLKEPAIELYTKLAKKWNVEYDEAGQIGKRYRRQDEIGTPFCITYDFDTLEDGCVTVRDRDTMAQERVKIDELIDYIDKKLEY